MATVKETIENAKQALEENERALGPEHLDVATALDKLAGLLWATRAYGQAEGAYKRALAIKQKVLGMEHPEILSGFLAFSVTSHIRPY